jgi:hypothetical protein
MGSGQETDWGVSRGRDGTLRGCWNGLRHRFVLHRGAKKNQVIAMRPGGGSGGLGLSTECECNGTDPGTCTLDVSGQGASWYKGDGTCNSGCKFRTITTGLGGGGIFAE